jgi:ATPase subunit of ABC transporter with duplicated ATPase domains
MLRLRELSVRRGGALVVDRLDWLLTPGRPAWVVGPNGAGKSSLLRVLAGLDAPASGSVCIGPRAGPALYLHAEASLPADATVGDWARFATRLLPAPARRKRTALWPGAPSRRAIGRLSTGERKRLLLDVILRQPGDILLLDEPYEHLSPEAKDALTKILRERASAGIVVVATNQLTDAARRDGGLRLEAGSAELLAGGAP